MGRMFTAVYTGTITAAGTDTDLFSIQPADDKPVRIRGFSVAQTSEVGDAAEEGIRVTVRRLPATFTVGSGGGTVTPTPLDDVNTVAFGGTVRANDTTVSTTNGTGVIIQETGWNNRNSPCEFWWPEPEMCPKARQGAGLVIRLETTPADDFTIAATVWLEEE